MLLQCAQDNSEALTDYCQSGRKEALLSRVKGDSMSTCRSTAEPLGTCIQCSPKQGVHQCPKTKRWPEDLWRLTSMPSLKGHFYVTIILLTRETSKEVASGPGAACSLSWASLYSLKAELWFSHLWFFLWRVFPMCRLRKALNIFKLNVKVAMHGHSLKRLRAPWPGHRFQSGSFSYGKWHRPSGCKYSYHNIFILSAIHAYQFWQRQS